MYLQHFGLSETPFSLTPDTGFFYRSESHQRALNVLLLALRGGEGVLKVTGEVGTGKTLLCRTLLAQLKDEFVTAYIPNPHLMSEVEAHRALARELGLKVAPESSLHQVLDSLTDRLIEIAKRGGRTVLCIDEAQTMSNGGLETVRLLSNLETEKRKLLQIVLFAQPELDRRLEGEGLRQLRQRITFAHTLTPLDDRSVQGYIEHRLSVSGYRSGGLFSGAACRLVKLGSGGVPRAVNILAHKAMLCAYGRGRQRVGALCALRALNDTAESRGTLRRWGIRNLCRGLAVVFVLELLAFFLFKYGGLT